MNAAIPMSDLIELPVPPQLAGVVGTLNCCASILYNYVILSTMVYWKNILFVCMCVMYEWILLMTK